MRIWQELQQENLPIAASLLGPQNRPWKGRESIWRGKRNPDPAQDLTSDYAVYYLAQIL